MEAPKETERSFRSTLVRNTRGFTGDGLWAYLRPGSMKDNFAPTETGTR